MMLREFLEKKMRGQYVGSIEMERNDKTFRLIIKTSRPGVVIGRSGEGSVKLEKRYNEICRKEQTFNSSRFQIGC